MLLLFWPKKDWLNNKNSSNSKDKKLDYMSSSKNESEKSKNKESEKKNKKSNESVLKRKTVSRKKRKKVFICPKSKRKKWKEPENSSRLKKMPL